MISKLFHVTVLPLEVESSFKFLEVLAETPEQAKKVTCDFLLHQRNMSAKPFDIKITQTEEVCDEEGEPLFSVLCEGEEFHPGSVVSVVNEGFMDLCRNWEPYED